VGALAAFLLWERHAPAPMLPLDIFASRQFSSANAVTFVVYGALGGSLFLLPIQLQRVVGYSPLASGVALVPITVLLLLLSARSGRLASRIGPRLPMTLGPLLVAAGFALFTRIGPGASYLVDILPASLVYGLGLVLTVAPLTATVLAAAPPEQAGIASAVNNDVARTAGLLAVAVLPVAAGISGADALAPAQFAAGFRTAMAIAAVLCAAGGVLSWLTIRNPEPEAEPERDHHLSCPLNAPAPAGRRS
jgi:MFS family permease